MLPGGRHQVSPLGCQPRGARAARGACRDPSTAGHGWRCSGPAPQLGALRHGRKPLPACPGTPSWVHREGAARVRNSFPSPFLGFAVEAPIFKNI